MACLNTAVAEGCGLLADRIEAGASLEDAVRQMFQDNFHAVFTGNGYSEEWPIEAARRGLPNLRDTPSAVATFNSAKNKKLFLDHQVFTEREVDSRQIVMLEEYCKLNIIEAQTGLQMVDKEIIPAIIAHIDLDGQSERQTARAAERKQLLASIDDASVKVAALLEETERIKDPQERANYIAAELKPGVVIPTSSLPRDDSHCFSPAPRRCSPCDRTWTPPSASLATGRTHPTRSSSTTTTRERRPKSAALPLVLRGPQQRLAQASRHHQAHVSSHCLQLAPSPPPEATPACCCERPRRVGAAHGGVRAAQLRNPSEELLWT
jgi:hypothetical protein